jgi:general secretion pathway protein F
MAALAVFVVIVAGVIYALRATRLRTTLADAVWRLPGIGERMKVYQLARFYRTIGMLLKGGVPLVTTLKMGAQLLHPVLRARLASAGQAISEGRSVSESLDANELTTPVALRMLAVGEQSGNMGEMMDRIASFHDEEISRWVEWFTRMFEPILMAVIGLLIGGIVILMYMPIFELAGSLQ